jgi:hypothetical protein
MTELSLRKFNLNDKWEIFFFALFEIREKTFFKIKRCRGGGQEALPTMTRASKE